MLWVNKGYRNLFVRLRLTINEKEKKVRHKVVHEKVLVKLDFIIHLTGGFRQAVLSFG